LTQSTVENELKAVVAQERQLHMNVQADASADQALKQNPFYNKPAEVKS